MTATIHLFKRILKDGKAYIPIFSFLGGIGLLLIPVEFYALLLSRKLIDRGFLLQNWDAIKDILFLLMILFLVRTIIHYGAMVLSTKVQLRINQTFQNRLFSYILYLPLRFFIKEPTGQLMSRILDDANRFSNILSMIFGPAIIDPIKLVALLSFLIYINGRLCVVMILSTLLSLWIIDRVGKKLRAISKKIQQKNAGIYAYVEQIFSNIELVKSKAAEKQTQHHFNRLIDEMIDLSMDALKVTLYAQPALQVLKYFTLGGVFIYGSWMISDQIITIGTMTIFLGGTYLFFNTLNSLANNYGSLRESLARMEILYEIMDSQPENASPSTVIKPLTNLANIEFRDVHFAYEPSHPVLRGVSFLVRQGEVLGITGQSGSGKTTLVRLLLRFYRPDSGTIHLAGQSLEQIELPSLRHSVGIAFQENLMLNNTIRENIAYGDEDLSLDSIIQAANTARAHSFIERLPHQYESLVGERGTSLSGGERQRLAIARAIITNPEILILDEATSFLEVEQEEVILKGIKKIRRNKITIIISHRLSAMEMADCILTLDNGRVLDIRTPGNRL
ncbi:MAG: ABC transporter ATP-binding protein [Deltaproteobacteria bacterium]|nr:ABC transporter ATP-binding protein [Deltaproteobacteria bacterium]